MIKICTVCGMGLGSSLIVEMNVKSVLTELNLTDNDVYVTHKNLNSFSPADDFDYVVCGMDLADSITFDAQRKIVLNNIMDKDELKTKLKEYLKI